MRNSGFFYSSVCILWHASECAVIYITTSVSHCWLELLLFFIVNNTFKLQNRENAD